MAYKKGKKINEGKTKIIWAIKGREDAVIIENKNDITAFDDPSFTKKFASKAEHATTITSRVFELLKKASIPVAYEKQISPTEFLAPKCEMVSLEVVARRYAVGSFLKRHPEMIGGKDQVPHRFHRLVTEFFLKTKDGGLTGLKGKKVVSGLDAKKSEEDPFILNPKEEVWKLYNSKKPLWEERADLKKSVKALEVISGNIKNKMEEIDSMLRKTFLVLEGAWSVLGFHFIDLKIEFGVDKKGNFLVADVIDNDSWRLRDMKWEELSKEAFRQGEELNEVEKKYGFVASLSQNFRVPAQTLVLWRGSDSDSFPEIDPVMRASGLKIEEITLSGHKSTHQCIETLEKIIGNYPDGGVVIAKVGRSNGLGPILAARAAWPVLTVPATADTFPNDIWSSVRMPSSVPVATVWPESNAVLMAMEILAQKNPILYAARQAMIEKLDI